MVEPAIDRTNDTETRVAAARRRVAALKGFYVHVAIFALVILGLALVDWLAGGTWWFYWVFLGWGVGVLGHAFGVFSNASHHVAAWEDRKVREILRDEDKSAGRPPPGA